MKSKTKILGENLLKKDSPQTPLQELFQEILPASVRRTESSKRRGFPKKTIKYIYGGV